MVRQSIQKKLTRVRPPRLQSSYDLQVGAAIELDKLPFLPGLMDDLEGQVTPSFTWLHGRRFVDVNESNFDSVLQSMKPAPRFITEDRVLGNGNLPVSLGEQNHGDFEPEQSERQIRPSPELIDLKGKLSEVNGTQPNHEHFSEVAPEAALSSDKLDKLQSARGKDGSAIEDASSNQNEE